MAAADVDVDLTELTGEFDLKCTVAYNVMNLGRFILNRLSWKIAAISAVS